MGKKPGTQALHFMVVRGIFQIQSFAYASISITVAGLYQFIQDPLQPHNGNIKDVCNCLRAIALWKVQK